jgi:four helix bundle protein
LAAVSRATETKVEGRMKNAETDLVPRTKKFARRVIRLYSALPKQDVVAQVLGKQLLRSGTSVGANYREARRGRSKAEFIAKIGDCLKEADETLYWLELLAEEKIFSAKQLQPLLKEADELVAIFTTISKRARGDG